ncbi:glycosyltransferase [Curtobacterium sp. ODYSSEY 48 V2]|uniref:glycosyltransferase n=1 Tax=unclassified Curtobacterium TaxID=257496 RepID=UPI00204007F2|nr:MULTISPECIES: glycosyltransferase [unclassified Curtobacterium]MCM3506627.1 glycosyltransferase [Curtobacterium sp. ODYSSEY 48 V2]MDT0212188.1 glycosyltransferase [Curtobacterium sp. BRD11]
MRIALVTDYYLPTLGGVQTAVRSLAEALTAAGHDVTVFCPDDPAGPAHSAGTAQAPGTATVPAVVGLPVSPVFRPDGYPFAWSPRRLRALLRREFAARRVDVVHTHSEMFAALGGIRAAQDLGIPVVHTMHGRIDVYTRNVLPVPAVTTALLAFLHATQVPRRGVRVAADTPYTRTRTARRMWRVMLAQSRASDHVVVPSRHFAHKLVDRGVRTPVSVVSNGIEPAVLDAIGPATVRTRTADEPLRVLWVGRLSPEKRPEVLVEAARSFPPGTVVDVLGDGVARAAVARAAAGTPVRLHGSTPHDEVLAAMRRAHVLVSSSSDFDNQPMVMLEAVATGLPVVHCDPDLAEVVPDGGGFTTPTPDAAGIASVVRRLHDEPEHLVRASAALVAARDRVEQRVDELVAVYASVLRPSRTT